MTARRRVFVPLVVAAVVAATTGPTQAASRPSAVWVPWPSAFAREAAVGSTPAGRLAAQSMAGVRTVSALGRSGVPRVPVPLPQTVSLSKATRTLYVTGDTGVVSVIDAGRCNARRSSGCDAPVATMTFDPAGSGDVAVDEQTGTGYVSNPEQGTVSVFDVTRCNAHTTSGCADAHATVTIGGIPIGLDVNERSRTLYVGNVTTFVSVIDISSCNRSQSTGCAAAPAQVTTNPGPLWPTVDEQTNTVYVPENGEEGQFPSANTLAVIDGAGCNANVITGCGQTPVRATVGGAPVVAAVDPMTRTVYVENADDLSVSVLDGASCNARDTSGCGETPATIRVGNRPNSNLVVDQRSRALFVVNTDSDTISSVDVRDCHAGDTSGCGRPDLTIQTGNAPFWIELDPRTGTLYVTEHIDEDVAVFDVRACNAQHRSGCRREAPIAAIPDGVWAVSADPRTHTLYAGGGDGGKLSLLDTRNCRAGRVGGCAHAPFEFQLGAPDGSQLNDFVLDRPTHTLYVINTASDTLFVLDTATCNVARRAGCAPLATIAMPSGPFALALNARTRVLYTANLGGSLSLIDATHCNATDTSGCAALPQTVALDGGPFAVAVDPGTDTTYVSRFDAPIAVLHGAELVSTLPTPAQSAGLAIDRATHTLYVANWDFDAPGRVSVVDTRACSGLDASGCEQSWPSTPTGRAPFQLTVDPATHRVFSANFADATVSVIDGASCNAIRQRGCGHGAPRVPIGNIPFGIDLARRDRTVYTANAPDREVSVIDADAPCRTPVRCER